MSTYRITHELPGRMRIRYGHYAFDDMIAEGLKCEIASWPIVKKVDINPISGSLLFIYDEDSREPLIELIDQINIDHFDLSLYEDRIHQESMTVVQKRAKSHYLGDAIKLAIRRYAMKWLLPVPVMNIVTGILSLKYIVRAIDVLGQGRVEVAVLDGTSIGVSMLMGDFATAGDIIFLLRLSDLLQDYTREKATIDLKNSLSLNVDHVWIDADGQEKRIPMAELKKGDTIIIHTGSLVPVDGEISHGEALINDASFTGEPLSKMVSYGDTVFAGTVVEEGTIYVKVRNLQHDSRMAMIVDMINNSESLKATVQARAEHLADAIVPYSFLGFIVTLLLTGDMTRATSILMVDYSCAIKLSTSISVISAMQEASHHGVLIKGGKYLEGMAHVDTIVFDKTGTLTHAKPVVMEVTSVDPSYSRDEILRIAACLEEHFPHSMANAIVEQANIEGIMHPEMHSEVEYIIAHGIASRIDDKRVVIGSGHFIFEDEQIALDENAQKIIDELQSHGAHSLIYMAVAGRLSGIISIYDPLKKEATEVIRELRKRGFKSIVMLTGDSEHTAKKIADELMVDDYRANVLPEDKSAYIFMLKEEGKHVAMIGDGVNDAPALSAADVSISMQDSSDLARELADITLVNSDLRDLLIVRDISSAAMSRITRNYTQIVLFNSSLLVLGALGIIQPGLSAFLHNASTIGFSALSSRRLIH